MALSACLVTGRQRAAIATIEVRGFGAAEVIDKNLALASPRAVVNGEVRYGTWHGVTGSDGHAVAGESVVVARVDPADRLRLIEQPIEPLTKTEDVWELHCHGGEVAAQRILDDLQQAGVAIVDQNQWQAAGGDDLLHRESIIALTHSLTLQTAAYGLDQVRGAMREFAMQSLAASEQGQPEALASVCSRAADILRFAEFGMHLSRPWTVVLAGLPNVGKSSLINALVGYHRSITWDQPGTTRDVLQADASLDGWPVLFSDTAGIRSETTDDVEQQGIDRARASMAEADLVIWVEDAAQEHSGTDRSQLASAKRWILVANKIDLSPQRPPDSAVSSSCRIQTAATMDVGIQTLRQSIVGALIPDLPPAGSPLPINARQVDALRQIAAAPDLVSLRAALQHLLGN